MPEAFATYSFFRLNNIYNCHGSILDLVFCNNKLVSVKKSFEPAVSIDPYHPALYMSLSCSPMDLNRKCDQSFYNFPKADYHSISTYFEIFNWSSTFKPLDIDSALNVFYNALHKVVIDFVPKCKYSFSSYPPWFTKELKHLVILKKQAHARFKSSSSIYDYKKISFLRAKFKYLSKKSFRTYSSNVDSFFICNPMSFWKFVKKNISNSNILSSLKLNGCIASCDRDSAELFSTYFSSVYSSQKVVLNVDELGISSFDLPSNVAFSVNDVFDKLSSLRGVRRSLDERIFPSILKFSSVTPILKSGDPSSILNYRPFSIQSHISKILESLVLNDI
ncbi:hypothetical protein QTP88_023202 [Uroleucon formosanum]